jgi:nucleoside-diphosphate-sugar epimerase
MRVLLAGATGVIGRRLVPLLTGAGHQVTGLARTPAAAERVRALGAEAALADVFDPAALSDAVRAARPDVVIHQLTDLSAGPGEANARIRRIGTRNLVEAARAAGTRRIIAQSISWAYRAGQDPATEDVALDLDADEPRRGTVAAVAALEDAVGELPEWVVLRYGLLYGPGTWYAATGMMADRARAGELAADADVTSFVHVDDAAAAAAAALSWPSGAVNVCDDEPAAGYAWVPVFCASVGAPSPGPADAAGSGSGSAERHGWARGASNLHARADLGWNPSRRSWRDGFGR